MINATTTVAATLGAALGTIAVFVEHTLFGVPIPPEVAGAEVVVFTFLVSLIHTP